MQVTFVERTWVPVEDGLDLRKLAKNHTAVEGHTKSQGKQSSVIFLSQTQS